MFRDDIANQHTVVGYSDWGA